MKQEDVKIGGIYKTKIGEAIARVEVVHAEMPTSWSPRTRFAVRRIFNDGTIGPVLPKRRTAAALREDRTSRDMMRRGTYPAPRSKPVKRTYEVIVGNIGRVLSTPLKSAALKTYKDYVADSKSGIGRAGGQSVVLFDKDGEILMEHDVLDED